MSLPTAAFDTYDWEAALSNGWPEEELSPQQILNLAIRTAFLKADDSPDTVEYNPSDTDLKFGPAEVQPDTEAEGQYTSLIDNVRYTVELPAGFMLQVKGEEEKLYVSADLDSIKTLSGLIGRTFQITGGDTTRRDTVMHWLGQAWATLAQSVSERGRSNVSCELLNCQPSMNVLQDGGSSYKCVITHPNNEAVITELELQWQI